MAHQLKAIRLRRAAITKRLAFDLPAIMNHLLAMRTMPYELWDNYIREIRPDGRSEDIANYLDETEKE